MRRAGCRGGEHAGDVAAHATNDADTFIGVADDCPTGRTQEPLIDDSPVIAALHWHLIAERPYGRTSDDVIFKMHAVRR